MTSTAVITQALIARHAPSPVPPLTSREYWDLTQYAQPQELEGLTAEQIGERVGVTPAIADRIPALLDRGRAIALATEELEHKGFWILTPDHPNYPQRLRGRLGNAAPAILYGAGDKKLLDTDGIGVVGSRNIEPDTARTAAQVAQYAAANEKPTISGGARGVDLEAMRAALDADGTVVAALADSLIKTTNDNSVRRAIADGQLCLITPYAPTAPFSTGNAMGRNKLIYALAHGTVVVRSDHNNGGTWAGASEALTKNYGKVWSWLGAGTGPGNAPLVERGASPLHSVDQFPEILTAETVADRDTAAAAASITLF